MQLTPTKITTELGWKDTSNFENNLTKTVNWYLQRKNTKWKPTLLDFKVITDGRGSLISLEENKNIPFTIKRIYYLYNFNSDLIRGKHAHKTLQQVLICTSGSCTILLDNGVSRCTIDLSSPSVGFSNK